MNVIDLFLNKITMYRLVLYALIAISLASIIEGALGWIGHTPLALASSLLVAVGVGWISHQVLVRVFRSGASSESWLITPLILFLIIKPADSLAGYAVLALGVVVAAASKYVLAVNRRHIFNPAAISLVILGLLGSGELYWWVGSVALLPVVLVAGALVARKVRRFGTIALFTSVALITFVASRIGLATVGSLLALAVLSGPLVFFATIMLTEPQTAPQTRRARIVFAIIVGVLFALPFHLPPLFASPALALVVGNIYAFAVGLKRRQYLTLQQMTPSGDGIYEFSFASEKPIMFTPGQYLEWTLPHKHVDSRGDRRYFTIASSPTETDVKIVVRIDPEHASSFKKALLAMQPGDIIWASQLSGDFVRPRTASEKIVCIAGGIGMTPFRSMARYDIDRGEQRDVTLYYTSLTATGFSNWQLFNEAARVGWRPNYVITGKDIPAGWAGKSGFLTIDMIQADVPEYKHALFYLSGPNVMVVNYKKMLLRAGVPRRQIKTDYFPGF